jgi:hypothetical protein
MAVPVKLITIEKHQNHQINLKAVSQSVVLACSAVALRA